MSKLSSTQISINDKTLNLFCVSLGGKDIPNWVTDEVQRAFEALAPYIKEDSQVLYMRDIAFLAIDGIYPVGHCYNAYEAMIALPDWDADKQQVIAAINHELHHMARWQNPGYGDTLGGAILSEGIATFYEALQSGWKSPWAQAVVSEEAFNAARKYWDDASYNHGEWFFEGPFGKWVGYGIGYNLAKQLFNAGFDLEESILIKPIEVRAIFDRGISVLK